MGHGDERACRLEIDLGVAQTLGGSDELRHGAAHAGEALGDLVPLEITDRGHGVGQHVHSLREFYEGRTGLDEIGGLNALHRLRDRFKTEVKLGPPMAETPPTTSPPLRAAIFSIELTSSAMDPAISTRVNALTLPVNAFNDS